MQHIDYFKAMGIAVVASLIIALIEIPSTSKASMKSCLAIPSLIYWIILSFGNIVTTLLASLIVDKVPASLLSYYFMFCAFFGVFAFEGILKNTNITMFDRGVLTIQSWIDKAKNNAAAAAIDRQETFRQSEQSEVVEKLMTLSEEELNTRILQKKNDEQFVSKLDAAARASAANPKKYKAFQLAAMLTRNEILAFKRSRS